MPPTAGTHMLSTACMTWIWTTAQAHRVQGPSHTTIPTRMLTISQPRSQAGRRPYPSHLPRDPSVPRMGKQWGKATMDLAEGAMVSADTNTIIMNAGEGEDTGGVVEEEGGAVVLVDKKVIRYHIGQKIMARRTVLDH